MKKTVTLLCIGLSVQVYSQSLDNQVIASSGAHLEKPNGSLSETIGEPIIEFYSQGDKMLTQGFHQTMYKITAIPDNNDKVVDITLYPNPTKDVVNISSTKEGLNYRVIDLTGKLLLEGALIDGKTSLTLSDFANGIFLIDIYSQQEKFKKTYKVTKH